MTTLALIGAGRFGSRYIQTIKDLPNVNLKYICSKDEEKRKRYKNEYITVVEYKDLFAFDDIDGIIIATPASTHCAIAAELLKKGYNLLIEKPLTTSLKQAQELMGIWETHKPVVLVGHIYLFHPGFQELCRLKEQLGRIRSIDFVSGNWGPFREDASTLWDWSPHDIAMSQYLSGSFPEKVEGWGVNISHTKKKNDFDSVQLKLTYPTMIVTIHNTRISPEKIRTVSIVGDKGSMIFNSLSDPILKHFPAKGIQTINEQSPEIIAPDIENISPLQKQIQAFVEAISFCHQPISDMSFAVDVIKILALAEEVMLKEVDFKKGI